MPDSEGKLTKEDEARVQEWVAQHWPQPWTCPISKHTGWELAPFLARLSTWSPHGFVVGGPIFPSVALICRGCGYTMLFNAVLIGLVPADAKPEEREGKKESENG